MNPTPSINSQVTFLYYKDLTAPALFWGGTLGLPLIYDLGWVKMYRLTPTAAIGLVDEARGGHKADEGKAVMLSLVTDHLDNWFSHLQAAGVEVQREPTPENLNRGPDAPPVRSFLVLDPGGYSVEFFEWLIEPPE